MQDFVHQQYVDGMGNMIEFHQRFRFLYDVHTLGDMSLPETKIFRENSGHLWLFGRSGICLDYVFFWWFSWGEEKCWNKHILGKFEIFVILLEFTLPETKITLENRPSPKKKLAFQPSIFRGYVSFTECIVYTWCNHFSAKQGVTFVCGFCCRHFFKLFCAVCLWCEVKPFVRAKFLQVLRKTWCDVEDFSCQLTMFQDQVLIKPLLFLASKKSFMHFHPKNIQSKLSEKKHRYFQSAILGTITLSHPVWQSGKMRKSMEILSHWWEMLVPWRVFNKKTPQQQ